MMLTHHNKVQSSSIGQVVTLYSLLHAVVDATCSAVIFNSLSAYSGKMSEFSFYIVLYNVLAFGLQVPFGAMVDRFDKSKVSAVMGCLLTAAAALFAVWLPAAVLLAGVGNAMFHVGGGVAMLGIKPGKAAIPGIYVAPGAIGLLVGTLIGKGNHFPLWLFSILLTVGAVLVLLLHVPKGQSRPQPQIVSSWFELALMLFFTSVALRALVGITLTYSWKTQTTLLVAFTCAVALGKAMGGIVADRFGWIHTTTIGLIMSAPLLYLGFDNPLAATLGVFLFNLTMPVTLTAMANLLPGRTGLAFGLTTLALLIGTYPKFTGIHFWFYGKWAVPMLVLFMALILWFGLRLHGKSTEKVSNKKQIQI